MYDFKQLSPADFEEMTRDVLQSELKVRLESFKTGRDRGIDLRYSSDDGNTLIVQCKHYARSGISNLVYDLRTKESPKIVRLKPARYILVTSLPLSPDDKSAIQKSIGATLGSTSDIIGMEDLNNLLGLHPEIEKKHFKLWLSSTGVLQRVLSNAERIQTEFDVDRITRRIPLYVQSSSYGEALNMLSHNRFLIISGLPGVGKTTLADMLMFSYLEQDFEPIVIKSSIREGRSLFRPNERQIFYFDDFLGETFLSSRFDFLGKREDAELLDFMGIVHRSRYARLLLTSREHILQNAFRISERFARDKNALAEHQYILTLGSYKLLDRARILYNHIYFSDLPEPYKKELLKDGFYMGIIKHRNFNPRLVEWLSQYTNLKHCHPSEYRTEVGRVLEKPDSLWRVAFEQQISEAARSVLLALYSLGGSANVDKLEETWAALHTYRSEKYKWSTAAEDWRRSLQDLEGGFLEIWDRSVRFINPSVKDFLDAKLISDRSHLEDLSDASVRFEQIVNVWALVCSDQGVALEARLSSNPDRILSVIDRHLGRPYQVWIVQGGRTAARNLDTRPEVRLQTLVSVADRTKAAPALSAAVEYTESVLTFLAGHFADIATICGVFRMLDGTAWEPLKRSDILVRLKEAMWREQRTRPWISDLSLIAAYAEGKTASWTEQDRTNLVAAFETYVDLYFRSDLEEMHSESEVEDLGGDIERVGQVIGLNVEEHQDRISERQSEIAEPASDHAEPERVWVDSQQGGGRKDDEAEARRLFEGLA